MRYGFISLMLLAVSTVILVKLFDTTVIQAGDWNKRSEAELNKEEPIQPERGNILAANGSILACNITCYDVKLDLRHNIFEKGKFKNISMQSIDSLADSLDAYYPRIPDLMSMPKDTIRKYSWHTRLKDEIEKDFKKRTRALVLVKKGTEDDFKRIRQFPFIKRFVGSGQRIPLYTTERKIRTNPFGKMALRSIGRVHEVKDTREIHGYSGLEKDLDSLLYGKTGTKKKVAMTRGFGDWVTKKPKRGYDILTTIDIDMQDILEEELQAVCDSANAEWGTAILMEVETGEIKAISNLERFKDGTYGEALNRAVLPFEPGSVMKPISLMIAFEDGLVKNVTDAVDCSPFQRTKDPHAPAVKNMKQVIEMSSNTGIARVIFRGYDKHPETFYDRLSRIGFFTPLRSGIAGEAIPNVRRLTAHNENGPITMTSRHLDLARQAYGYNTMIPPIYTLAYYNAIANNGVYRRPHLVRSLRDENGRDSILPVKMPGLPETVCSPETARKVRECIREVVWGEHGTARAAQDDRVEIAGKTGTAYPVEKGIGYNLAKRRYAFAGFFPYKKPKYSCIALILAPGGTSANRTSAQVVKRVALKLYSRGLLDNKSTFTAEKHISKPTFAASTTANPRSLANALGVQKHKQIQHPGQEYNGGVPDVTGYDARTAVLILEKKGYNVLLRGKGRVVSQSYAPGTTPPAGRPVTLTLRQ